MSNQAVGVRVFRWAGQWGPFRIKIPCGECALTKDVIGDTLATELDGIPVALEMHDWLSEWWRPLLAGGWHAPIVMVEGRVVSQGVALNRGVFAQAVIEAHVERNPVSGNHVFGKVGCPHCERAKHHLKQADCAFDYHDVVRDPRALYEMLGRVKPIIGAHTPVTVPQIWIDGHYVGGARELGTLLQQTVEPNPDRGRCSLSPDRAAASPDT